MVGDEGCELTTYPGFFAQIVTNLLINSLLHGFRNRQTGSVVLSFSGTSGMLNLCYEDDGEGISKDHQMKVFDPFFTTDKQSGTGLGLHIIHNIVTQKLSGTIQLESEQGAFTRFIIMIPVGDRNIE